MSERTLVDMRMARKIPLIICLPVIGMLVFAGWQISMTHKQYTSQKTYERALPIVKANNAVLNQMQEERAASIHYLMKDQTGTFLQESYKRSDRKIVALQALFADVTEAQYGFEFNRAVEDVQQDIKRLSTIRDNVKAGRLSLGDTLLFYKALNENLLLLARASIALPDDAPLTSKTQSYVYLMHMKNKAGEELAAGLIGFEQGWTLQLVTELIGLVHMQNTYVDLFLDHAPAQAREAYSNAAKSPAYADVSRMRKIATGHIEDADPVPASLWMETLSQKLALVKKIEQAMMDDLIDQADESVSDLGYVLSVLAGVLLAFFVFSFWAAYALGRAHTKRVQAVSDIAYRMAKGDYSTILPDDAHSSDLVQALDQLRVHLLEMQDALAAAEQQDGQASDPTKKGDLIAVADQFDTEVGGMIGRLAAASQQLQTTAQTMQMIAEETSNSSQSVAQTSEAADANVNAVASAMEEMSASAAEIATQIVAVRSKSNDTATSAKNANETVKNLDTLVGNIGEVVTAIQDIAEQTNLLALNATIEAARAGEAGKGFAIVADEVKKLATETGKKTEEINTRITEIQNATHDSVDVMQRIIDNIAEIDESVTTVSASVEEQTTTTDEVVRSITKVTSDVQKVAAVILEVQTGANETGSSAHSVLEASGEVSTMAEHLKDSVQAFLHKVRA